MDLGYEPADDSWDAAEQGYPDYLIAVGFGYFGRCPFKKLSRALPTAQDSNGCIRYVAGFVLCSDLKLEVARAKVCIIYKGLRSPF